MTRWIAAFRNFQASPFAAICGRVLGWPVRVARARRLMQQMAGMDDHELADIGLYRQDLRDVSAIGLDQDPTEVLARKVEERRAARSRAPRSRGSGGGGSTAEPRVRQKPKPGQKQAAPEPALELQG